jgi:hypothetical protein
MTNKFARQVVLNNMVAMRYIMAKHNKSKIALIKAGSRRGCPTHCHHRHTVNWVFNQLGRKMSWHAYRMTIEAFYVLYRKIQPALFEILGYYTTRTLPSPNGRIHPSIRLACVLCSFAGGEAVDIAVCYGISDTKAHNSINYIIDSTNLTDSLPICFPASHTKQELLAQGFKNF